MIRGPWTLRLALGTLLAAALAAHAAEAPPAAQKEAPKESLKIKPKKSRGQKAEGADEGSLLQPDVNLIDTPTTAVLDYGGYSSLSRFYARGGLLEYLSFGVFQRLNLGASLAIDGLIGADRNVRLRAPNVQVKYRFYDGDRQIPSFAVGFDGQGFNYNQNDRRYNHRQRGFFVAASQELGLPGLMAHPSVNISDFDTNSFFGAIPLSYNIKDKALVMLEWDNINNWMDSRLNTGLRFYVTPALHIDFAVRGLGQGGFYSNGDTRGPERIVQLKYTGNF